MLAELRADACYYHKLYFPRRSASALTWLRLLLSAHGLWILAVTRLSAYYIAKRKHDKSFSFWLMLLGTFSTFISFFISILFCKSDILASTSLAGGIYLSDYGHIIMGAHSVGSGTIIHNRVTIGKNLIGEGTPEIGRNVWIGPYCVIYGDVKIGDGVTVLPYTVLTKSIPAGAVVQGNPARIIARNIDNSFLRQSLCTNIEVSNLIKPVNKGLKLV